MTKAFTLQQAGEISNLKLKSVDLPEPLEDEVQVKHLLIGVNRFDLHYVKGDYQTGTFPFTPGIEALGIITKKGSKAKEFEIDDKVLFLSPKMGAFAEASNVKEKSLMIASNQISDDVQLAAFSKGLSALYLGMQAYISTDRSKTVVHGAAGGVGHLLCQFLKIRGAKVIAVVGSGEKKNYVNSLGVDHIIDHTAENLSEKIKEYTDGFGVNCIYDCYGNGFLEKNLKSLAPFGILVNYGDVLGKITNLDLQTNWGNSNYFQRPSIFTYKGTRIELVLSARILFEEIKKGTLKPKITKYKFKDIPKILNLIAENKITGSVIAQL